MERDRHERRRYAALHKDEFNRVRNTPFQEFGLIVIGLLIFGAGLATLLSGHLHYRNWWGAPVFGPYALIIGVLIFVFALRGKLRRSKR